MSFQIHTDTTQFVPFTPVSIVALGSLFALYGAAYFPQTFDTQSCSSIQLYHILVIPSFPNTS
jgi:hypothetical protein